MHKCALIIANLQQKIIAKAKRPHTIGEELILLCAKDIVGLMIGTDAVKKLSGISLSDNTVQRRISEMANDIISQLVEEVNGN